VVSHQGRTVLGCVTGGRVARDRRETGDWFDPELRRRLGIGPIVGRWIELACKDFRHAAEIRGLLEYREFSDAEAGVAAFIASRVRKTRDTRRELFDRAVDAHRGDQAVGQGHGDALNRASYVLGLGTGAVDVAGVEPVKLAELARYGMLAKAPKIRQLESDRRIATLLATVRHLEGVAVDDALLLFDLLMSTVLLSRASRAGDAEKLKNLPKLRVAAARLAAAWTIVTDTPPIQPAGNAGEGERVTTVPEVLQAVEQVVSRERLEAAVATVLELLPLPSTEDDGDLEWRVELVDRYGTVKSFASMLASVIPWGATAAGSAIVAALKGLPKVMAARKPASSTSRGSRIWSSGPGGGWCSTIPSWMRR